MILASLEVLRQSIDVVDKQIIELLKHRLELSHEAQQQHPEYRNDYDREIAISKRYSDELGVRGGIIAEKILRFCLMDDNR